MTNGQKVILEAMKYIGTTESPYGSNRGVLIDKWQARWGLRGQPWCGMFTDAMYAQAGVNDAGLNHPGTGIMCNRASAQGAFWNGRDRIPTGAIWVKCGIHTALVVKDYGDGTVQTIGGNEGQSVKWGRKYIRDGRIVIPPSIKEAPPPPDYDFVVIDEGSKQEWFGTTINGQFKAAQWVELEAARKRQAQLRKNPIYNRQQPRVKRVNVQGKSRFRIMLGDLREYGPFEELEFARNAKTILERRLGRKLKIERRESK